MCKRILTLFFATALAFPAFAQDGDADLGKAVYDLHCSGCHGTGLRNPGTSFDLKELKADERARFDAGVLDGKNMMPPWRGTIAEAELDQLWAYIREYAYE